MDGGAGTAASSAAASSPRPAGRGQASAVTKPSTCAGRGAGAAELRLGAVPSASEAGRKLPRGGYYFRLPGNAPRVAGSCIWGGIFIISVLK